MPTTTPPASLWPHPIYVRHSSPPLSLCAPVSRYASPPAHRYAIRPSECGAAARRDLPVDLLPVELQGRLCSTPPAARAPH